MHRFSLYGNAEDVALVGVMDGDEFFARHLLAGYNPMSTALALGEIVKRFGTNAVPALVQRNWLTIERMSFCGIGALRPFEESKVVSGSERNAELKGIAHSFGRDGCDIVRVGGVGMGYDHRDFRPSLRTGRFEDTKKSILLPDAPDENDPMERGEEWVFLAEFGARGNYIHVYLQTPPIEDSQFRLVMSFEVSDRTSGMNNSRLIFQRRVQQIKEGRQ